MAEESAHKEPKKSARSRARTFLKRLLVVFIILFAGALVFNGCMHAAAAKESRRTAGDDDWGGAFRSLEFTGQGDLGVLFLHNLHGTPQDFRLVMDALEEARVSYYAPMRGGEGAGPTAQRTFTADTFADCAEEGWRHLSAHAKRIVVVGASAGGLEAADVASRFPVERRVLISPYFAITPKTPLPGGAAFWTKTAAPVVPYVPKGKPAHIDDPEAFANFRGLSTMALAAVVGLMDHETRVSPRLGDVSAPVLCLLSHNDQVIDVAAAERAVGKMGSDEKRIEYIDESNHMILIDYGRERAAKMVIDFILGVETEREESTAPQPPS